MVEFKHRQNNFLEILQQQTINNWLAKNKSNKVLALTEEFLLQLENFNLIYQQKPKVLLIEANTLRFIAGFLAAIIGEVPVFLGNPHWLKGELNQVQKLLEPDIIWGTKNSCLESYCLINPSPNRQLVNNSKHSAIIGISTGGSSGKIRFAIHTPTTLTASVQGFSEYFNAVSINSCCTLPLYHVSGLIQLWRSLITQGKLAIVSYKDIKQGIKPFITPQEYFISLVPTQLQYLLDNDSQWLSQFKTILLGGAPSWRSLLDKARQHNMAIATTYGMTETASGISYLKPKDFSQGNYSSGKILPHAQVDIVNSQNKVLKPNQVGTIRIQAKSLYYGYYPQSSAPKPYLITDDLGLIDQEGFLHIIGRNSQKIITGGENVYPQEVEAAILATKLVKDVCVIGVEDAKWGQAITALLIPITQEIPLKIIQEKLQQQLSKYKIPKYWFFVQSLPRDQKGKMNHLQLKKIARKLLQKKEQM